jgi:hypothetical protein
MFCSGDELIDDRTLCLLYLTNRPSDLPAELVGWCCCTVHCGPFRYTSQSPTSKQASKQATRALRRDSGLKTQESINISLINSDTESRYGKNPFSWLFFEFFFGKFFWVKFLQKNYLPKKYSEFN